MLQPKVSIPFIIPLIGIGVAIAVAYSEILIWAWVFWGLATAYLSVSAIYYLTQSIVIDVYRGNLLIGSSDKQLLLEVEGFISSRHPIAILNLSLCLLGWRIEAYDCGLPDQNNVNAVGQSFRTVFHVHVGELEEGRSEQVKGKEIDIGKICATTRMGCYLSEPFVIPGGGKVWYKESWYKRMKKRIVSKKVKEHEECITKKELHDLLNKASQPVKKSEKAKS